MTENRCINCMRKLTGQRGACPHCGFESGKYKPPEQTLPPGTTLNNGKYVIGRVLGRGGFGVTYVALDTTLDLRVAVKECLPRNCAWRNKSGDAVQWGLSVPEQEIMLENFVKEARKMARADEIPGVVRVREYFYDNETAYIVMNYVDGETLARYLRRKGPLNVEECFRILAPAMDSLAQAHKRGLVHRDVSPNNIMIERNGEKVWVLDLGAAKDLGTRLSAPNVSMNTQIVGTPGYTPLEQYSPDGKIGPWTDVYAMSSTFFRCMTGQKLQASTSRALRDETPELLRMIRGPVGAVLSIGLAQNPDNRYQSMTELRDALETAIEDTALTREYADASTEILITPPSVQPEPPEAIAELWRPEPEPVPEPAPPQPEPELVPVPPQPEPEPEPVPPEPEPEPVPEPAPPEPEPVPEPMPPESEPVPEPAPPEPEPVPEPVPEPAPPQPEPEPEPAPPESEPVPEPPKTPEAPPIMTPSPLGPNGKVGGPKPEAVTPPEKSKPETVMPQPQTPRIESPPKWDASKKSNATENGEYAVFWRRMFATSLRILVISFVVLLVAAIFYAETSSSIVLWISLLLMLVVCLVPCWMILSLILGLIYFVRHIRAIQRELNNGVLTISSKGETVDIAVLFPHNREVTRQLKIGYSITGIGDNLFAKYRRLESVELADSVTRIGKKAFAHCSNLQSVKIPDSVRRIESQAFADCPKLAWVSIPADTEIVDNTFEEYTTVKRRYVKRL